ncbi:uncharacterized protein METZ01_LOCUS221520, partial [marine metagenome]
MLKNVTDSRTMSGFVVLLIAAFTMFSFACSETIIKEVPVE